MMERFFAAKAGAGYIYPQGNDKVVLQDAKA